MEVNAYACTSPNEKWVKWCYSRSEELEGNEVEILMEFVTVMFTCKIIRWLLDMKLRELEMPQEECMKSEIVLE